MISIKKNPSLTQVLVQKKPKRLNYLLKKASNLYYISSIAKPFKLADSFQLQNNLISLMVENS